MTNPENIAFIDAQNLQLGTTKSTSSWKVDLFKFRIYLKEKYDIQKAYYFIGFMDENNQDLYSRIQESGFIIIFRSHSHNLISNKKENVDTDIVFSIMREYHENQNIGKIYLVSGDGDYFKTIKYLHDNNKLGKILFPSREKASSLYKKLTGSHFDYLDKADVKKKIEYKKEGLA